MSKRSSEKSFVGSPVNEDVGVFTNDIVAAVRGGGGVVSDDRILTTAVECGRLDPFWTVNELTRGLRKFSLPSYRERSAEIEKCIGGGRDSDRGLGVGI
jgi:hypothetical protein